MLEGLDRINWSALTHAYGGADDVPGLLRARASSDPEKANEAESELFGNIWHQGTVYEASAYAVPFLVELLEAESTVERPGIVMLLASIANGHSYLEVHGSMRYFDDRRDTPEFQAKLEQELSWKEKSHEAVAKHVDFYWRLLDQDPTMSVCVPYLIAAIPAAHRDVRARMPGRIAATESFGRASALLAYSMACAGTDEGMGLFASLLEDANRWVAFGAAYGMVVSDRVTGELPRAFDVLLNPLRDSREYVGPADWFWGDGQTEVVALDALRSLASAQVELLLPRLPDLLPALGAYGGSDTAVACLKYAFHPDNLPTSREALSEIQRSLLTALARDTNVVYGDDLIAGVIKALVGDNDMKKLARYLEGKG